MRGLGLGQACSGLGLADFNLKCCHQVKIGIGKFFLDFQADVENNVIQLALIDAEEVSCVL